MKSSRREGILFRTKRAFVGVVLGSTGWSRKQGEETTRKDGCWEEPAFWEVQEVYRNEGPGVIYKFSRFPTSTKLFGAKLARGLRLFGTDLHGLL